MLKLYIGELVKLSWTKILLLNYILASVTWWLTLEMVEILFNMIVGYILTYVVKSYLIYSLLNLCFLFYLCKWALYFLPLKSRKYFIWLPRCRRTGTFRAGWFHPQGGLWQGFMTLKTHPRLFIHWTGLSYFRFIGGDYVCIHISMTNIWYSLTSISFFFHGEWKYFLISLAAFGNGKLDTWLWPCATILIVANTILEESDHFSIVHKKFLI